MEVAKIIEFKELEPYENQYGKMLKYKVKTEKHEGIILKKKPLTLMAGELVIYELKTGKYGHEIDGKTIKAFSYPREFEINAGAVIKVVVTLMHNSSLPFDFKPFGDFLRKWNKAHKDLDYCYALSIAAGTIGKIEIVDGKADMAELENRAKLIKQTYTGMRKLYMKNEFGAKI